MAADGPGADCRDAAGAAAAGALAPRGADAGSRRRAGGHRLHAVPPARPVPAAAVLHAAAADRRARRQAALLGLGPPERGGLVARRDLHPHRQLPGLPGAVRPARLRVPPPVAHLPLVVEPARAAPQPAADDTVVRRPQSPLRRSAAWHGVCRRGTGDRRGAVAVRAAGRHLAVAAEPAARQCAAAFRLAGRSAADLAPLPSAAPRHRPGARGAGQAGRAGRLQLRRAVPVVGHAARHRRLLARIPRHRHPRPACPRRAAARATTGAACCASSGWASSACSAAPERVRAAAWSAALLC